MVILIVVLATLVLLFQSNTMAEKAGAAKLLPEQILMDQVEFAKKSKKTKRSKGRVFVFSPRRLTWAAYHNGRLIKSGRASGGKKYCHDVRRGCTTPRGKFSVYRKGSKHCRSNKYPLRRGGAPMPHCMFFKGGYAIHGSPDVPNYNASHGCIRVRPSAARWLSKSFMRIGTQVVVTRY